MSRHVWGKPQPAERMSSRIRDELIAQGEPESYEPSDTPEGALGATYEDGPVDPYEASDVVKFDVSTLESARVGFERYGVGNVVELKGAMHIVVWVDRDKGLAGLHRTHPGKDGN